jgi:cell division protein FtsW (lipid II flippase)
LTLVLLLLWTAYRTREPFGRLVLTGIALCFAGQSFQNMAMTIGVTPITGLPLPFVSQGGSSLLTSFLCMGVAVGCASRRVRVVASRDLIPAQDPRKVILVEEGAAALLRHRWPVE